MKVRKSGRKCNETKVIPRLAPWAIIFRPCLRALHFGRQDSVTACLAVHPNGAAKPGSGCGKPIIIATLCAEIVPFELLTVEPPRGRSCEFYSINYLTACIGLKPALLPHSLSTAYHMVVAVPKAEAMSEYFSANLINRPIYSLSNYLSFTNHSPTLPRAFQPEADEPTAQTRGFMPGY